MGCGGLSCWVPGRGWDDGEALPGRRPTARRAFRPPGWSERSDRGWSPDRREHVFEHLQIRENSAFAVIRHSLPEGAPSHRTIWIFKKTDKGWKITSFVIHVGGGHLSPACMEFSRGLLLTAGGVLLGLGLGYYLGKKC